MTVTDVTTVASKETPAEVTAERRGDIFADLKSPGLTPDS
jgi:hypothetical protein